VLLLSEHHCKQKHLSLQAPQGMVHGSNDSEPSSYMNSSRDCIMLLDMSQQGWKILISNQKWVHATGTELSVTFSPG